MVIKQNLVPASRYRIKCPSPMTPIGICIHNTANDASAENEIAYMIGNDSSTSFHFAVDDKEIIQGLPLDRNGWHAGDGSGPGNRQHIGIEICYSKSGGARFLVAEHKAAELTAYLLKKYGWGIDRVKKHQDFSGKKCPHRTLELGWERFLDKVKKYMKPEGGTVSEVPQELQRFGKGSNKDLATYIDELRGFVQGGQKEISEIKTNLGLSQSASHSDVLAKILVLSEQKPAPTQPSNPTTELPSIAGFELETITFKRKA